MLSKLREIADSGDENRSEGVAVTRLPKYLSPSSYAMWKQCPYKFYLSRMTNLPRVPNEEGEPNAVGLGFDAHVKAWINQYQKSLRPDDNTLVVHPMEYIKENLVSADLRILANTVGRKLLNIYMDTAGEGLLDHCPIRCEVDETKVLEGYGVPLRTKIDAILSDNTVLDWKVRGYNSAPKSPTQGWIQKWKGGKIEYEHEKCNLYFDDIEPKWAEQLTIYNFAVGHKPGEPLVGKIHELSMRGVVTPDDISHDTVACTWLYLRISRDFQLRLAEDLAKTWEIITKEQIPVPSPNYKTCYSFRKLCERASDCKHYLSVAPAVQMQADLAHKKGKAKSSYDKILDLFREVVSSRPPEEDV